MEIMNENANVGVSATENAPKSNKGLIGVLIGLGVGAAALTALIVKNVTKKNDAEDVIECEDYNEVGDEEVSE